MHTELKLDPWATPQGPPTTLLLLSVSFLRVRLKGLFCIRSWKHPIVRLASGMALGYDIIESHLFIVVRGYEAVAVGDCMGVGVDG